jgi:hypothetical protein
MLGRKLAPSLDGRLIPGITITVTTVQDIIPLIIDTAMRSIRGSDSAPGARRF